MKPLLLDAFCGAGGCSAGYRRAGFDVIGVDINPQPNYPYPFIQTDALAYLRDIQTDSWLAGRFDAIHASPPCQAYSKTSQLGGRAHPDLVGPVRDLLNATGLPYVIENVPGSPLRDYVVLEGQMFPGLKTRRPRWFEANWPLTVDFMRQPVPARTAKMGRDPGDHEWMHVVGHYTNHARASEAMGINWMSRTELAQAIPPAFTEFIGIQLMQHLRSVAA